MNKSEETGVRSAEKTEGIPVLVITAPTASGKTALLEKLFAADSDSPLAGRAEIISADSMQVYKGLDAGTAKPDEQFLKKLPHHLIDICTPDYQFGSGEFVNAADILCMEIWSRGKLPVVCGGTMFYIRNFLYGLPPTPECNAAVREELDRRMKTEGAAILWNELNGLDPESAAKIHINDEYRIKRALEVCLSTGKKRSDFNVPDVLRNGFRFCIISLERTREELYERIAVRVDQMFKAGLAEEFQQVSAMGYGPEAPGMQAIGYREFFQFDAASVSWNQYLSQVRDQIVKDTRHYAKKQQVFIKGLPDAVSVPADDVTAVLNMVMSFLREVNGGV